jgi:hypothetical protein
MFEEKREAVMAIRGGGVAVDALSHAAKAGYVLKG